MAFFTKKKLLIPVQEGYFPCLSGATILQREFQPIIQEMLQLISVPSAIYESIYLATMNNIAEYCQAMPMDKQSAEYSLLNWQFRLSIYMLKLRRGLLLPQNSTAEKMAEQDSIWTYAFFIAGLIFQLHRIQYDRHIQFYSAEGKDKQLWHPLLGCFYQNKSFYSIEWDQLHCISDHAVTSILINNLIPQHALRWLMTTPEVFVPWWRTMMGDEQNNVVAETLYHAADLIKYPIFKTVETKLTSKTITASSTAANKKDELNSNNTLNSLLCWIQENHKQQDVFKVTDGLFITTALLNEFVDAHRHWENTSELIDSIKMFLIVGNDNYLSQLRSMDLEDRCKLEGIVVKNAYLSNDFKQLPSTKEFISDYSF